MVRKESDIEEEVFRRDVRQALLEESRKGGEGPERWSKAGVRLSGATAKEFVKGLRLWHDLKPKRVRALCARVGREKTDLTFEPGEVMTGVRPAVWLDDGWLEGALDGRTGLFHVKDVEYLSDSD